MNFFNWVGKTVKGAVKGVKNVIDGAVNFLNRDGVSEEFLSNSFTPNQNAQQYQDVNNAWSAEQAQIERDWESPVNQLQMMKQAGLSPATYSSPLSQTSPPTASSNAHGGTPIVDPVQIGLASAQNSLLRAQARNLNADADIKEGQKPYLIESARLNLNLMGADIVLKGAERQNLEAKTQQIGQDIAESQERILNSEKCRELMDSQQKEFEIRLGILEEQLYADLLRTYSDIAKNDAERELAKENARAVSSQITLNIANAYKAKQEGDSYASQNFFDGMKVNVYKKHQKLVYKMIWNEELQKYNLAIEESGSHKAKSEHERNKWVFRNRTDGWYGFVNYPLNVIEGTADAVGGVFGSNVGVNMNSSRVVKKP